jgi:MFS superfamily sulfate permease-like transporter
LESADYLVVHLQQTLKASVMIEPISNSQSTLDLEQPRGDAAGFARYLKFDFVSGLLVFLIALPLCLGIAGASGFPAINGVFTAIVGGVICGLLSNSELTIKGPAAGMIAIVLGAVSEFANMSGAELSNSDASLYLQYLPSVVAVALISGIIQIVFGAMRAGALADLFPSSVIHGLLASIGIIIIGKQLYPLLGLKPNTSTEAYEAFLELPSHLPHAAWQVAVIGLASLVILLFYPSLKKRFAICKIIPPQLVILVLAIPISMFLLKDFAGGRTYEITHAGHSQTQTVKTLLVKVPETAFKLTSAFIYPDFKYVSTVAFWKWVLMFTLVGSLESLLSAKAVDVLDPWKRKSDLNRDLLAVGIANTAVASIGGLPMISEIVRSSANKDFGARTRWSNFFHGLFLLLSIIALPQLLNMIPLTALAAMLVYAGCRLAHYKEFLHMWHVGREQLLIFVSTIIGVLMTDLLIGVGIGMIVKIIIELCLGVRPFQFFKMPALLEETDEKLYLVVQSSAVFSNWLLLKRRVLSLPTDREIVINLANSPFVDHTVMTRLSELQSEFATAGRKLTIEGLENHRSLSSDKHACQKGPLKATICFPS